jgi:dephospho-CoA kinase
MRTIGLTGGIGSGKSTVAKFLTELGAVIIDADKIGHEALMLTCPVSHEVISVFGQEIVLPDGSINRRELGRIVFTSPELLARLNTIVHPWMYETMKKQLEDCRKKGERIVVLDAAVLLEAGWTSLVDEVWVTMASQETVIKRLIAREDGLSEADALARIKCQMSNEERIKHADVVINTDRSLDEVKVMVKKLWEDLLMRMKQGGS